MAVNRKHRETTKNMTLSRDQDSKYYHQKPGEFMRRRKVSDCKASEFVIFSKIRLSSTAPLLLLFILTVFDCINTTQTALQTLPISQIPAANTNFEAAFQGECGKNNRSNPCEHICLDLHDGTYECACFYGFTLAVDGYSCAALLIERPIASSPGQERPRVAVPAQLEAGPDTSRRAPNDSMQTEPAANDNRKLVAETAKSVELNRNEIGARRQEAAAGSGRNKSLIYRSPRRLTLADTRRASRQRRLLEGNRSQPVTDDNHRRRDKATRKLEIIGPQTGRPEQAAIGGSVNKATSSVDQIKRQQASRDKWQLADFEQADASELDGAQGFGFHEEDEERLDLDVRSIMLANDKLVRQLARSVGAAEDDDDNNNNDDQRSDETNNSVERMRPLDSDQRPDYELEKLAELVAKTIEDYAQRSRQQPADRELDIAHKPAPFEGEGDDDNNNGHERYNEAGDKINEAFANTNGKLLSIEGNQVNSSSGLAPPVSGRPRRSYGIRASRMRYRIAGQERPVDDILCGTQLEALGERHDKPVYRDCTELPECESGGQCVVELTSKNNNNDNNNNNINSNRQGRLGAGKLQQRARCRCPVGRGGHLCQKPIQRLTPKFTGRSYLALPMVTEPFLTNLRLVFKPQSSAFGQQTQRSDYLTFGDSKVGQQTLSASQIILFSQKFVLLLDDMSRIELRYLDEAQRQTIGPHQKQSAGKITRVIGSRDVEQNKWNELIVTDASSDSQKINSPIASLTRIVLVTPDKIDLRLVSESHQANSSSNNSGSSSNGIANSTELFVAGLPDALQSSDSLSVRNQMANGVFGEKLANGFAGCIGELSINQREYNLRSDLNGDALDGFDIGNLQERKQFKSIKIVVSNPEVVGSKLNSFFHCLLEI